MGARRGQGALPTHKEPCTHDPSKVASQSGTACKPNFSRSICETRDKSCYAYRAERYGLSSFDSVSVAVACDILSKVKRGKKRKEEPERDNGSVLHSSRKISRPACPAWVVLFDENGWAGV